MNLKELQEKRDKLVADARAALDEIRKNTDETRAKELEDRHDAIMAEFDRLEADIKREERVAAAERSLEERQARRRPIGPDTTENRTSDQDGALTYRSVFFKFLATGADPSALEPEERAVLRSGLDAKAEAELRAQSAGTTTAGGYLVPTDLATFIVRAMKAWGPMYDGTIVTDLTTTSGNPFTIPTVDDTANEAAARNEGDAMVDDGTGDVVLGKKDLGAFVFATPFIRFSMELVADSAFGVEPLLGDLIGERLGRIANRRNTTGSGTGQPNGIVTASSLGITAASATAIVFDEIMGLEHSVDPAYRVSPKCAYMMNDATLLKVRKLKDGNGAYIWQAGNVRDGVPATLNGRRFHINQHMADVATGQKAMIFGDLGKYFVRKVGQPVIGVMRERFWPDLGIAGLIRFDGELGDTAAVKHLILA